ncbi:metallo-mystery pair system four-Cys motif protein [Pleurocapsales cyanobacterium LEGE 10410]|nr:metallo-mystery pair system four-Cys motif protein [Pleurocapsales cyanobacterium LEGE 10410]
MFFFINKKSVLLATAISVGCYGVAQAQSDTKEIAIDFEAWVGNREFTCGESYDAVGAGESTVTPTDFRFYVSDVALIDEDGNAIPLELEQDGKWQYQNVALLDFEDGTSACDNGTAEMRTMVVGTIPEGDYQSLQFTLGVPEQLNHKDAAIAPSPLNLTSMWWNWQGGYKFLRVDLETEQAIANVGSSHSQANHSQNEHGNIHAGQTSHGDSQTTSQSRQPSIFVGGEDTNRPTSEAHSSHQGGSNSYLIHLGSTGCKDSAQSNLFGCSNPNRAEIVLEDFNPEDDVVIADLAELLYQTDLTTNQANTPSGCMSSPKDSDCSTIMQNLGLSFSGIEAEPQLLFWVE